MALLSVSDLSMRLGGPQLLDGVSFSIERGERVCLLGRNGDGKSTLLNILAGDLSPDAGTISMSRNTIVAMLPQVVPTVLPGTVRHVVSGGLRETNADWQRAARLSQVLDWTDLSPDAVCENLSGGMKRRVLLAKALAAEPDVLLLDEPTNHLDMESILWLENFLPRFPGAILFVTHDRAFLRKLATRVMELDRGRLSSWDCGYDQFLERKQAFLLAEEKRWAAMDKKLAAEEIWIRKGIEARRTRNEGRVRELIRLRAERSARRERSGAVQATLQEADRSGYSVIRGKQLGQSYGGRWLFRNLDVEICRGDKIGIVGPNGCGKSTLIRILLGPLTPEEGSIRHGTHLEVAYFDQLRHQLKDDLPVMDQVADGNEFVMVNGQRRHVLGYLEDFLFTPERARCPVRVLSGGERSRLLLARLFARPSNVLALDEPTNDLDIETLELLESLLVSYSGTVLLVSHDRDFLDEVTTHVLAFEGDGLVREYAGGYPDWARQASTKEPKSGEPVVAAADTSKPEPSRRRKLSNRERQELAALPSRIEQMEAELAALHAQMASPEFYRSEASVLQDARQRAESLPLELERAYTRWTELETADA